MFVSKLSQEQWEEARRLRADGAAITAIAERYGVCADTVRRRARLHGWSRPDPEAPTVADLVIVADAAADEIARPEGDEAAGRKAVAHLLPPLSGRMPQSTFLVRRALARRLLRIFDIELTLMELRMLKRLEEAKQAKDVSTAVSEAELRRVQSIIKTIDEVTELEADTDSKSGANRARGGKSRSAAVKTAASEADVFRREIAERIEKLIPPA